mmetsp:Transcript_118/g.473  ORF Transcript_118/g.473 Transcript_118/m.473 type:complete len:90 (+) Transcript_118:29-298(+)
METSLIFSEIFSTTQGAQSENVYKQRRQPQKDDFFARGRRRGGYSRDRPPASIRDSRGDVFDALGFRSKHNHTPYAFSRSSLSTAVTAS